MIVQYSAYSNIISISYRIFIGLQGHLLHNYSIDSDPCNSTKSFLGKRKTEICGAEKSGIFRN